MLSALLHRRFWIPAYLALAAGLWLPGDFACLAPAVPVALGGILFFTCLRIPFAEVASGLGDPALGRRTAGYAAIKLAVVPALAWAVVWPISPYWAPGIALVAMMPAGLSSVAFTDLHGGDRVLALFLIVATSLLAPVTVPLGMALVHPGAVPGLADLARQSGYILALLAIPFAAAQLLRAAAPGLVARGAAWWGPLAILSLVAMILVSCLANRGAWAHLPSASLVAPLALASLAAATAFALAMLLRRWQPAPAATAFACGALYMNNGLCIAYATRFHPGDAGVLLPGVLMQVPMIAAIVLWGRLRRPGPA